MSLAQLDGLWHFLCPSFRFGISAWACRPLLRNTSARNYSSYIRNKRKITAGPDPSFYSPTFGPKTRVSRYAAPEELRKWPELSRSHAIPGLNTEAAYEELRQASRQGDYGRVKEYMRVLIEERGEKPSVRLYHAMILANTHPQYGSPKEVASLLLEMVNQDLQPDSAIYHAALKVLSIHPDYLLRTDILEELHQRWFTLTADGWHDVIIGLIRERQVEMAMRNLELVEGEGVKIKPWLYDILVYNLCDIQELDEALKIMQRRLLSGESLISPTLWYHLLDTASRFLHYDTVTFVWHNRVEPGYIKPPSGICINVLNTAARHGDSKLATAVFYALSSRKHTFHVHHYEALLEAWLTSGNLKAAFTILCVMQQSRILPTEGSTRAIYLYLTDNYGRPAEALKILQRLKDEDRPIPHAALNVILEAYNHYSDLGSALETYKSMHLIIPSGPDTSTFNTLFRGCTHARRKDLAMFLASEMLALNIPPNALTYDRLILNCLGVEGQVDGGFEDAWRYFEEMRQMGWWPRAGTVKHLAERGCEVADERVWQLVGEERGLTEPRMQYLKMLHWGKRVWDRNGGKESNVDREGRGDIVASKKQQYYF